MKRNQKGFSLLELVISIAIIAIMSSALVWGIGALRNNDLKKAAATVKGTLHNTRTYCLSKKTAYCEFYHKDGKIWYKTVVNGDVIKDEQLSGDQVTMKYIVTNIRPASNNLEDQYTVESAGVKELGKGGVSSLVIAFDHSSGALKPADGDQYLYALFLCRGDATIRFVFTPLTGKIEQK